jgi:predicted RNA-binding Zn-ribbon protein involved in translation (DUF1610 family)
MTKSCLYCDLQLPDAADFCPQCGRPIERGFAIRPIQEPEFERLHKEMKGKDDLIRQQGFSYDGSDPLAHMEEDAHPGNCPKCGARLARRARTLKEDGSSLCTLVIAFSSRPTTSHHVTPAPVRHL